MWPACVEPRQRLVELARGPLVQRPLTEEAVEPHPVAGEGLLDLGEQQLHRPGSDIERIAVGGAGDLGGQLGHVLALIAVLGHLLVARPGLDRLAEQPDLAAGVIEVVLARDFVPVVLEDPRQRVAVGSVAAAGGDQRPGRVGRHELDQDPLRGIGPAGAEPLAGAEHRPQRPPQPGVGHEQVQEARARHLPAVEVLAQRRLELGSDPLGDLAGRRAQHGRQQHRCVGRVVTLVVALGALDPHLRRRRPGAPADGVGSTSDRGRETGQRGGV